MEDFIFAGLSGPAWITIATMVTVFGLLICTKLPADLVFLGSLAVLLLTGTLSVEQTFSGFSSSSVLTIGFMFVIVAGLTETGVLHWITRKCLGTPKTYTKALLRLMAPVSAASAFLSNTTVVAMFLKIVLIWSKKLNIKPSKLLIPLSYASVFGGLCTIIGTPPNLIISGMYAKETGASFGFFEVAKLGLICLIFGYIITILLKRFIPERNQGGDDFKKSKEFTTELLVPTDCPHIGETLKEANLIQVNGGHIVEVLHFDGAIISPVPDDEFIMGGDRLIYTGLPEKLMDLKHTHGLVTAAEHVYKVDDVDKNRTVIQAVVPEYSSLIGRTFMSLQFEKIYNIVLIAVAREGKRIENSPRETVIMPGDTLLIECNPDFLEHADKLEKEIVVLNGPEKDIPISKKTLVSCVIMLGVVLSATFKIIPLVESSLIGLLLMLATGCCNKDQARASISGSTLIVFASSIGLGTAIQATGLATTVAQSIQGLCGTNPYVSLIVLCASTCVLSEFISNTAAAAIFFPIAYQMATLLGVSPTPFMFSLMMATASFATPIGSPTHLLVYGPGGYKFTDFMVLGILMNSMTIVVSAIFAPIFWPF